MKFSGVVAVFARRTELGVSARSQLLVGVGVVLLVHGVLVAVVTQMPRSGHLVETGRTITRQGCSSVVSPCQLNARVEGAGQDAAVDERTRRCPEPLRRRMRRHHEHVARTEVDLLQAEIVERLGEPDGNRATRSSQKVPVTPELAAEKRVEKVRKLVDRSKLGKILQGGDRVQKRKSQLNRWIGTATGRRDGDGLVSRKGSAYVREVRVAMQHEFVLPGTVPVWLRKTLQVRIRITRMTANGQVISYRVVRKSGNEAFDRTVRGLMARYKAGSRSLPPPPPHILAEINSRGLEVLLRGG